jgi:hypothetical protein
VTEAGVRAAGGETEVVGAEGVGAARANSVNIDGRNPEGRRAFNWA